MLQTSVVNTANSDEALRKEPKHMERYTVLRAWSAGVVKMPVPPEPICRVNAISGNTQQKFRRYK